MKRTCALKWHLFHGISWYHFNGISIFSFLSRMTQLITLIIYISRYVQVKDLPNKKV